MAEDTSAGPFIVANSGGRLIVSHQDALNETGEAYTSFHGWTLKCLWCPVQTTGKTKGEALSEMRFHYDMVAPGHGGIT